MNFFNFVYQNTRSFYNWVVKYYVSFILKHPFLTIIVYLLVIVSFSTGLYQLKFITDNERLMSVKNSQIDLDIQKIQSHFREDPYEKYFQHHLLDIGYYVEVIIFLKCSEKQENDLQSINFDECNILNNTYLKDYNQFFDSIISLKILSSDLNNQSKNFTYHDICPKRTNRCAIEGGILRSELFQKKLLNNQIGYSKNDPTHIFIDSDLVDGTSIDFLFGKYRREKCEKNDCFVNGSIVIRNRFDLKSNSLLEKTLALKYMDTFVEHMNELKKNNYFKNFNFSFYTTHTLGQEIEHYSKFDLKYVFVSLVIFTFIYFLLMLSPISNFKLFITQKRSNCSNNCEDTSNNPFDENLHKYGISLLKKALLLIIILILQLFFTLFSGVGLASLIGVQTNSLLYSIFFVILSK